MGDCQGVVLGLDLVADLNLLEHLESVSKEILMTFSVMLLIMVADKTGLSKVVLS